MNKKITTFLVVAPLYVGAALLLSFFLLKSIPLTILFIVPILLGSVLHKKLTVLLILTIVYITVFHTLTTILWTEFKVFDLNKQGSINFIIYNPFSTSIFVGFLTYIMLNSKTLISVLIRPSRGLTKIRNLLIEVIILSVVLVFNYIYIISKGGHPVVAGYFKLFVLPIYMFLAIALGIIRADLREADFNTVVKALLISSCLLACFGIFEFLQKENPILSCLRTKESLEWYAPYYSMIGNSPYRIFTLMGHPLNNASCFLAALVYSLVVKRTWAFLLTLLFMIANVLTFSRTTIVLAPSLLFLLFFLKKHKAIGMRFLLILSSCLIVTSVYVSPLRHGVEGRFGSAEGQGSAMIRVWALEYVKNNLVGSIPDMLLGKGAGKSREISEKYVRPGLSFEIPWIMMAIDNGIIATIIYMGILMHVLIVLLRGVKRKDDISIISFLVICGECILLSSQNAIISPLSQMGLFLWLLLALSMGYKLLTQDELYLEKPKLSS
jgi:hypothetical protein